MLVLFTSVCVFLSCSFVEISCQQLTKIWIPNTNYDDPKNWLGHELPCETSTVIFPKDLNAAISLPGKVRINSIDLPYDGELLLKPNGFIKFSGDKSSSTCKKEVVQFKKINIEPWLKPTNWKTQNGNNDNIATPHVEKVPCIYDNVIFPNGSSFWVQYPEISLSVNSFNIEGQNVTNSQLEAYLFSEPGSRQFRNLDYQMRTDVITVKNIECKDKTGCLCHKNAEFILSAVCNNLKHICNVTHCLNPVTPVGHCCPVCGAYLLAKAGRSSFNLAKFKEQIHQYLYIGGYKSLDIYISKVLYQGNTNIQIVIIEKGFNYNGDSISAAYDLQNNFMSNLKKYKLKDVILKISGAEYWPGQKLKTSIAIVLGTLLAVLLTLSVIYLIYGPMQEKQISLPFKLPNFSAFRPFVFVRFENSGDTEGGLEFRNKSVASSLFNLDRAFENPMFEEPLPSTSEHVEDEPAQPEGIEFKNPLYSDLKDKNVSDEE